MFLSLLVYTVSALIMYIAAQQVCINQRNTMMLSNRNGSFFTLPILFSIIFFGLLCGVRYNVGADNLSYIKFYLDFQQKGEIERTDFEPLFLAVQYLFAKSGLHYMFYNGFWASVEIGFVYYALRREKYVLPYVALFIILGPIFLYWTNGIRQCVASCIFIFLIDYIVDRKFVKYCVGVMICFLIHKSALILLPLYFLLKKAPDISRYRVYLVIILMACAIIGSTPLMLSSGYLGNIIAQLGYEHYALYVSNFDADSIQSMAWGPGKIGIFLSCLLSIWVYPMFHKKYNLGTRYRIYFLLFFIGACLFNLLSNTSHIFLRPVYYLYDLRVIIIPTCIYFLHRQKKEALFLTLCLLSYFYNPYSTFKAFSGEGLGELSHNVYKFFFLQ